MIVTGVSLCLVNNPIISSFPLSITRASVHNNYTSSYPIIECISTTSRYDQLKSISAVLDSADRVILARKVYSFTLNFLAPHGFPHIPLFTSPSCCISSCTARNQARKCGQLFPACHDAPQPSQCAAAQTDHNRGSFSKIHATSFLTLFFSGGFLPCTVRSWC
jgi:hypothetical protein